MAVSSPRREDLDAAESQERSIAAYVASPDRTVFTESGNSEGWIATDTTVAPER